MTGEIVTVFGGSGFVGRNIVRELAKAGYRVRVAVRRPNEAMFLLPMGSPGQIALMQANVRDLESVTRVLRGADAVINLVGLLYQWGRQTFDSLQTEGAERVARVAAEMGINRMIQLSAIGADPDGPSEYARSKGEGERRVRQVMPGVTILRPSIVFGPEDDFFNRFATMARFSPLLPLVGGGQTKLQPVHVDDVADAALYCLTHPETAGRIYELGGPRVMTFRESLELMLSVTHQNAGFISIPFFLARIMGFFAQLNPFGAPAITVDQVRTLTKDNVVGESGQADMGTLQDLGITPTAAEVILPTYLYRFREHGQYDAGHGK